MTPKCPQPALRPPEPNKRRSMQAQRRHDTFPELRLRSALHRRGLRFFLHRKVLPGVRREVDIVFVRPRVAVFVDGCFWHSCPQHGTHPVKNAEWWRQKLERNVGRDADTDHRLSAAGWKVMRIWEHEIPEDAAERIALVVRSRRRSA